MTTKVLTTKNKLLRYAIVQIVIWSIIIITLLATDLKLLKQASHNLAMREAEAHYQKDEAFRYWATKHGGFYVFTDERTPPNPYLNHIEERDIETPSGKKLTLMNPAYAMRQMLEDYELNYGVAGHITSLQPLRPENTPDEWERAALKSFENGNLKSYEYTTLNGEPHLRYMEPLVTKQGCLKCHEHQGYKVGDIRGGVSVSVPLASYIKEEKTTAYMHMLSFAILWILGFVGIIIGYRVSKKQKEHTQVLLQQSHDQLESKIKERTAELLLEIEKHKQTVEQLNSTNQQLSTNEQQLIASEKILKINEERYKGIIHSNASCIAIYQPTDDGQDFIFMDFNPMAEKTDNISREEVVGKKVTKVFPGVEEFGLLKVFRDVYSTGIAQNFPVSFYKDKHIQGYRENYVYKLSTGEIIAVYMDVTEQKRNEQMQKILYQISNAVTTTDTLENLISQIQNALSTIIDTSNFYVALYDSETDMLSLPYYADEKDKFTSYPAAKTLTKYVIETKKTLLANIDLKKKLVKEGKLIHQGSLSKIWLGIPLKVEGNIIGVFALQSYTDENAFTLVDIKMLEFVSDQISISIERKMSEENLRHALKKANESARLKSAFLATMSHELRTPLNAIIGFSELINKDWQIDEIISFANTINSSGNHLLNIVNDIFDITLIEAGVSKINNHEVNIITALKETHKIVKSEQRLMKKDKLVLDLILKDEKELLFFTDSFKLKQILINLIKNALKFTNEGYVRYGFEIETDSSNNLFIKFYVEDSGIGIAEENKYMIFETFRQVDDSYTRTFGGTGIGLSISKKLVKLLGGNIWFDSEINKGTTFYFTIPYTKVNVVTKLAKTEQKLNINLNNKTILIVEDDEDSFEFLDVVLKQLGVKTLWAKNGEEAIIICKRNASINIVLMDINMDVMNGYVATTEIKKLRPELPIIAQTAIAMAGDKEKALDAGCDDYITKPINKYKLLEILNKYQDF